MRQMKTLPKISLSTPTRISPLAIADAYKESHSDQYPEWVSWVYSNLTPRSGKLSGVDRFIFFGIQAFLYDANETFLNDFFAIPEETAIGEFKAFYDGFFGSPNDNLVERVRGLHRLGYLPLRIKALPEGTSVPYRVPVLTIENTHPDFFWLTNFIETWLSSSLWHTCTSASTAHHYRKVFDKYAEATSDQDFMPEFQGHDFSFRGLCGINAAMASGAAHLLSFKGSDTCPATYWIERYYGGFEPTLIATSVPATEHSVMCAGGKENEIDTFRRLLQLYPTGILSVVSDTWDFWKVVTQILPALKDEIMARHGKLVIRPDSSPKTPVEIICGDTEAPEGSPERKGLVRCLAETFGSEANSKGFQQLDSHIGVIYGDSITKDVQARTLQRLADLGFSSTNVVLGIGSFTYQYVSRDTHGIAIKATAVGKGWSDGSPDTIVPIFKDPKTDNSGKKSACGVLVVVDAGGDFKLIESVGHEDWTDQNCLQTVYEDGEILNHQTFVQCRERLTQMRAEGK